jgi:hypothetical protein
MVFKKITLVGRSNENFEEAIQDALGRADQTLTNLQWATVDSQAVMLEGDEFEYQAEIEVAFELEH